MVDHSSLSLNALPEPRPLTLQEREQLLTFLQRDDVIGGCFAFFLVIGLLSLRKRSRATRVKGDKFLDSVLMRWNEQDVLTVRDLLAGGIHAFGRTSAGKSSSFRQIAKRILRLANGSLLVLCAKRDEYLDWLKLAKEAGRSKDVLVIDPSHGNHLNFIGYESERGGDGGGQAQSVTRFLMSMREVLLRDTNQAGGESQVWKQMDERTIHSAVVLLQLAGETLTAENLSNLIMTAPQSEAQKNTAAWQDGYCSSCIKAAHKGCRSSTDEHDFKNAGNYFVSEWPGLGDRTRGSVLMGAMTTLSPLNSGIARTLFGTKSTFTPARAIESRKIVIVNMPPDEYGDLGRIANIGLKFLWQQDVLRRAIYRKSPIAVIWGDEASQWISPFDSAFLSRCRSYRGCMVYLTQSMASYREMIPGDKSDAVVNSLLANFSTKAFFALGDHDTAEWAANLVGKELQTFHGGSMGEGAFEPFSPFPQQRQFNSSFNQSFEYLMQPGQFMNGLRTGAKANGFQVDAILVRSGVPFSNGLPVMQVTFDQRS